MLKIKYINKIIDYDGSQLAPHYIYKNFNLLGNSLIAFRGKCNVKLDKMVDLEDVKAKSKIYSEDMLHFIGEFFGISLKQAVLYQRLLIVIIKEILEEKGIQVKRVGDDIFLVKKKLSISIATVSLVSALIHIGINISSKNTPVATMGLKDLGLTHKKLALEILDRFREELKSINRASCKVKSVS